MIFLIRDWMQRFWNWFWYYRRGKVKYYVYRDDLDTYSAMASDGNTIVCNCYGSTPEAAKEIAKYRLTQANKE